ncbi:putative uncharacterized protein [Clostridium sp. CAG:440]|jgi:uncharacterized protein (UPF0333 family)|nr:putative uncharacterized protein [Clostridium sp. CAG:440]HJJ16431.1 hypothetical protein [Clostridiaceae bacterium]
MENASKALLMAAGVLMGVVILSLAAYLFVTFSSSADDVKSEIANNQLNKFNSQFLAYEQREDLTVYDILTAVNLAENNNKYYQLEPGDTNYITVKVDNSVVNSTDIEKKIKPESLEKEGEMKEDNLGGKSLKNYRCNVLLSDITGRVNAVNFSSNKT